MIRATSMARPYTSTDAVADIGQTPVPAASILMLRENQDGLEVLMMQRNSGASFAGGAMVFPGGKLSQADLAAEAQAPWSGYRSAALREAFEETGLLIAQQLDGAWVSPDQAMALRTHRSALERGDAELEAVLTPHGLTPALNALTRYGHWITPRISPKRFDTQFFLCAPPTDQLPDADGGEAVRVIWTRPADALAAFAAGEAKLLLVTKFLLVRLAQFSRLDAVLADAAAYPVPPIEPWVEERDGDKFVCIPEGVGYPQTAEDVRFALRG
jgi:8-oxo-dGTP pyrophosphatase MutT (NUDIX family)